MDQASTVDLEHRRNSSGRSSSRGSPIPFVGDRILKSLSLHRDKAEHILGDDDCSEIAQVADSGPMPIHYRDDNKSVENDPEIGSRYLNSVFPVSPDEEDVEKTRSHKEDIVKENGYKLPWMLDYIMYLINLALFGILGVLTRYLLQKLFGPSILMVTGDNSPLYADLPSNMLGSFLMGWIGVVFKSNIHHFSPHLAVGLSTGYLGSLTTFSGWNQGMLNLESKNWARAITGIILGVFLVTQSIKRGVDCASELHKASSRKFNKYKTFFEYMRVNSLKKHITAASITLFFLVLLWSLSGALAGIKLNTINEGAVLWLGCLVGPPGVWVRWHLARLNGRGIGRNGSLKWLPIGTLSANIIAACLMASLSTLSAAVNTKRCTIIISGIQFGFLGCLSTVSTFVAETYAMIESGHSRRAYIYELATILPSFVLGTLIYFVPVWTKHYKQY